MAETVTIKIQMSGNGKGEGGGISQNGLTSSITKENAKAYFTLRQAEHVMLGMARQAVNTGISHMAFYGGNTVAAEQLQRNISLVTEGIGIAAAFVANPILGGIALATKTASAVDDYLKYVRTVERQNYQAEQLAKRAGYLSNKNR